MDLNLITHWHPLPGRVIEWGVTHASAQRAAEAEIDRELPPTRCRIATCDAPASPRRRAIRSLRGSVSPSILQEHWTATP